MGKQQLVSLYLIEWGTNQLNGRHVFVVVVLCWIQSVKFFSCPRSKSVLRPCTSWMQLILSLKHHSRHRAVFLKKHGPAALNEDIFTLSFACTACILGALVCVSPRRRSVIFRTASYSPQRWASQRCQFPEQSTHLSLDVQIVSFFYCSGHWFLNWVAETILSKLKSKVKLL